MGEKKMIEMIKAAGMKEYNKEQHGDVSDYFQELLDAGKALKHKEHLDGLAKHFHDGTMDHIKLIAEVEKTSEEKGIPLHWLWEDEKEPVFDQDDEYEKESGEYEHEHEHDSQHEAEHEHEGHEGHEAEAVAAGSGSG